MIARSGAAAAAGFFVYVALAAVLGRQVLLQIGTAVASDAGDPLLTAAILHWNAHHVPLTDAWWQLPIFHPTPDALAFSEHLLGVSVLASPVAWLTGNPLVAYNLTMLLTFPLAAMAIYALVHRLTGSAGAAFVGGLAFAFAPYRMATLSHIQILSVFPAPLALLGLHAYLDDRRRRWLLLYGAAWLLQSASNGYALVFFTLVVALWVIWFVVVPRKWPDLVAIGLTTLIASVPLLPVLYKYATVHAYHGFERSLDEMRVFSADLGAVFCAPATLTVWGWVRVACRGEGELFPGAVIFSLFVAAAVIVLMSPVRRIRALWWMTRVLVTVAAAYALIVGALLVFGPITVEAAVLRLSLTTLHKPLLIALATAVAALLLSLARRSRSDVKTTAFYVFAAVISWLLTLGPTVFVGGGSTGRSGPFALLAMMPGASSLRVPARFWLMAMMCLAVVAGLCVARLLRGKTRGFALGATLLITIGVLADGWMPGIPAHVPSRDLPDVSILRGQQVLTLPIEPYPDIGATWQAVTGGWQAINGYSGNAPRYYSALASAASLRDSAAFDAFRRHADLHVVVGEETAMLKEFVEGQPGAVATASGAAATQYFLPRRESAERPALGERMPLGDVKSPCSPEDLPLLQDDDRRTQWACPPGAAQEVTIDLGRVRRVGAVVYGLGRYYWEFATHLSVETSLEGVSWTEARSGSILREVIDAGMVEPRTMRVVLAFSPREARYLRLRPVGQKQDFRWSVAQVEVLAAGK